MKLSTDIKPRKDHQVKTTVPGTGTSPAREYAFISDKSGVLVCDVENEAHISYLLDTGNFYPADDVAVAVVKNEPVPELVPEPVLEQKPEPKPAFVPEFNRKLKNRG